MSPSPIWTQSKKTGPNPARMDSTCRAPSGPDELAGLYSVVTDSYTYSSKH